MKRKLNSRTARIYRWFYNLESENDMPKNLCPYFWKLVFMWAMIVPFTLISIPFQLGTKFEKEKWGVRIGSSIIFYVILFCLFLMGVAVSSFFYHYDKHSQMFHFTVIGSLIWLILIFTGIVVSVTYIREFIGNKRKKDSKSNSPQEPKTSILVEFIKAKYNKYCPNIDWE